jgi:hypothetical protein
MVKKLRKTRSREKIARTQGTTIGAWEKVKRIGAWEKVKRRGN